MQNWQHRKCTDQCLKTSPIQYRMLKQKLSDKFSNIFNRDKKEKQQQQRKDQQFFNESFFECKLAYNPHRLTLIKVIANIIVGPDAGTPMMLNCKWYIKKNGQYSEIQGVNSSCYQPCIEDVGCSVLVHIMPLIEGKTYSGATITKETGPLELGSAIETKFTEIKSQLYYDKEEIELSVRIEAVFGKECEYSGLDYPQDGKLLIKKKQDSNFEIEIITNYFKTYFWITKEFPTLEFIRKSYNSIVVSFTDLESMRLAFKEGIDRQIFALLIRTLTANSTLDWQTKDTMDNLATIQANSPEDEKISTSIQNSQQIVMQNSPTSPNQQHSPTNNPYPIDDDKSQCPSLAHSNPKHQTQDISLPSQQQLPKSLPTLQSYSSTLQHELRIGQLNTELTKLKNQKKQLQKNYNIEKQNKCKLQHQIKKLNDKMCEYINIEKQRTQLLKINQKLNQDNRFYRNQLTLLNRNMKKQEIELEQAEKDKKEALRKLEKFQVGREQDQRSGEAAADIFKNQAENWRKFNNQLQEQNQELKAQIQKLENSLATTNRKLESLHQQKIINTPEKQPRSEPMIPFFSPSPNSNPNPSPSTKQLAQRDNKIANLQFKISNLQMLLKHRSGGKGNQSIALHKIINNLTQDIRQKSEQLQELKNINKQLLQKIKILSISTH